jgi:hypothetical protein
MGGIAAGGVEAVPRFVVLEHDHPVLHWDLMLEAGEALRTWRLAAPPQPGVSVAAEVSFDHRLAYLDYEGPVSGNRGCVKRWDSGSFEWLGRDAVRLSGTRLCGVLVLEETGAGGWRATFAAGGVIPSGS